MEGRTNTPCTNKIMQLLHALAANEELVVVATDFAKGVFTGGACAAVGLFVGGTGGLAAGGVAGAVLAIFLSKGTRRLSDILKELTPDTKEKLCAALCALLEELVWWAVEALVERVLGDTKLKNKIKDEFMRITAVNLERTIVTSLDAHTPKLLDLLKGKGGSAGTKIRPLLDSLAKDVNKDDLTDSYINHVLKEIVCRQSVSSEVLTDVSIVVEGTVVLADCKTKQKPAHF
ncbi:hypothetical protein AOLI_G00128600 [Acnodon oligacanthus]